MQSTCIAPQEEPKNQLPTVGLILGTVDTEYDGLYWKGVLDALQDQPVNVLCFVGVPMVIEWRDSIDKLLLYRLMPPAMVDGLVINSGVMQSYIGRRGLEQLYDYFESRPIVNVNIPFGQRPTVSTEDYRGMYALVRHLIVDHGLLRLACLRSAVGHHEADVRFEAYRDALTDHNIQYDEELVIVSSDFNLTTGSSSMRQLLASKIPFDAVVAQSDNMAMGALAVLAENGLRVPQDIVVTGFDDMERMAFLEPPLTTVRQPIREQAHQSILMLLEELQGGQLAADVTLPTEAIFRRSCGCCSSQAVDTYKKRNQLLNERITDVRLIEQNMRVFMTATDWQTLACLLAERLPLLGIDRCYLSIFDDGEEPQQSRLVAGFDEAGIVDLPPQGVPLTSQQIVSPEIWSRIQHFQMMVILLHVRDELIGYALLEIGPKESWIYETVRGQLSSIAKTIKLSLQVQGQTAHLEDVVRERTTDLLQLLEEREEWTEIVVHDLRNPLASIQMMTTVMEKQSGQHSEDKERLKKIAQTTRHMNTIISKLLEERHTFRELVNNQKISLLPIVDSLLRQQQPSLQAKRIRLQRNFWANHLSVTADPAMVRQVLDNLLSNAIKYSPFDSVITVSVEANERGVSIAVRDEGEGLQPEDHAKLFTKYGKLSARPTNGESSSGVGLYIVKKMIDAIGGKISAESEGAGSGSTFKIWLPD